MRTWIVRAFVFLGFSIPFALIENAVLDWTGTQIARYLGISSPTIVQVLDFSWNVGVPALLAILVMFGYHFWTLRQYGRLPTIEKAQDDFQAELKAKAEANRKALGLEPQPFDVSEWVNHETYFVWAAACLWVSVKPVSQINANHPAYPALQRIKGALESGFIKSLDGYKGMSAKVTSDELKRLAMRDSSFPKFLFPDSMPR